MKNIYLILGMCFLLGMVLKAQTQTEVKVPGIEKSIVTVEETVGKTEVKTPGVSVVVNTFGDTISRITLGRRCFEFIEDGNTTKVRMVKKNREEFKGHLAGFDMGINTLMNSDFSNNLAPGDEFMDINNGKSVMVGINFMQYSIDLQKNKNNLGIVTGAIWTINNYRFDHQQFPIRDEITGTTIGQTFSRNVDKSKLVISYLNIPLMLEWQAGGRDEPHFFVSAGGFVGFNIGSHIKVVYSDGNSDKKQKSRNDLNINPFQYGLSARIGYKFIKVFANYSFSTLYENNKGPELYPFTVGLTLVNF